MGGHEPPGYDVQGRKPVVNKAEAVPQTFLRFIDLGCAAGLARDLRRKGFHGKQGTWDRACHRAGKPPQAGQQQPCADASAAQGADPWRKWRDHDADLHKERGQLYRGHAPMDVIRTRETGEKTAPPRLAAGRVEDAAETEVRRILQTPEVVTQVLAALKRNSAGTFHGGCHRGPARGRCALPTTLAARTGPIIQSLARRVVGQQRRARPRQSARRGRGIIRAMVAPRQMEAAEGQNRLSADGTKAVFRRHPGDPTITGKRFAPRSGRMLRMATND